MSETNTDSSPQSLSGNLIGAAGRLAELMLGEVKLLEAMRADEIAAQLPDKRAAVTDYRDLFNRLTEQPELLDDLDPATKADLGTAAERLAAATQANARALKAGIEANARLVRAIALAVHEAHLAGGGYLANGSLGASGAADQPLAVSVNQVL
jgi:hypothetical protein